jgi:hypothetical protein
MNVIADSAIVFHNGTCIDDAVIPDYRTGVNDRPWHDDRTWRDGRRLRNNRARVNDGDWLKAVFTAHLETAGTNTIVPN